MSFSGPTSGIRFSGISSGLDTESIISRLLALERQPITRLSSQKAQLQVQQTALEQYKGLATSVKTAMDELKSATAFQLAKASSSDTNVATVTASSEASQGTYSLAVSKLAQAHKVRSDAQTNSTSALNLTGTFEINGETVTIDADDTLKDVALKINGSDAGVTASIIEGGANNVYLTLTAKKSGAANAIVRSDTTGTVLATLGLDSGNEVLAAQDAEFTIDGLLFTSASNTVSTVIPNVTLTLLKANETTPEDATINISRDTAGIRERIESLASAYNNLADLVKAQGSFDAETLISGPLFGESTVLEVQATIFNVLTNSPEGLQGDYKNLLAIGISFDSGGKMSVDASKVEEALSTDIVNVRGLFQDIGTISNPDVSFISTGLKTQASGLSGYIVDIAQVATQGTTTAGTAMASPAASAEKLTFRGALFNSEDYDLDVAPGTTLTQLIAQINSDPKLKDLMVASNDGSDHLVLTSKRYGAAGSFSVVSDLAAGADNSGIGTTPLDGEGLDVAGTINGEAATGAGQFLTGNSGNAKTDGLQLKITSTVTGNLGTLVLTRGAAGVLSASLGATLDFTSGALVASTKAIDAKIQDIDDRIQRLDAAATDHEAVLRRKFTAMEEAISQMQSQMSQLSAMLNGLPTAGGQ